MTDKEIKDLANKIADIIFKRQEEYDAQFQVDIDNIVKHGKKQKDKKATKKKETSTTKKTQQEEEQET